MNNKLFTLIIGVCVVGSALSIFAFFVSPSNLSTVDQHLKVLPSPTLHIDNIRQATKTPVEFTLCNQGSVPIRILNVETSCGCTAAELAKKELASGESVVLTLKFDSGPRRGTVTVRGIIIYRTQESEQSHGLLIRLLAKIDPDYALEPERLEFGKGRPLVQRISLFPRHIASLRIDKAISSLRFFKARVLPKDDSGRQEIEVTFLPEEYYLDAGFAELIVSTDSERQPTLHVPLDVVGQNNDDVLRDNKDKQRKEE